ncbi:MAG: terminase small subunit [Pseudomonadota bacterium]|nr:terminase small subunit [Pseudomonadota bacterium]
MALTGKKRAFADAVLAGLSNKEAAIKAGYSALTSSAAGSRLVKDKEVAAYIALARASASSAAQNSAPPAPPAPLTPAFDINAALMHTDPKSFLTIAMNDQMLDAKSRIDAAKALLPFTHKKLGETGKKEQQNENAQKATGRFGPGPAPRLAAAGGKKVP